MAKTFRITLESIDLGQALDGLRGREEAWRRTAEFLRTGETPGDSDAFVAEACSDWEEAEGIADHFRAIIEKIELQISQQGGW